MEETNAVEVRANAQYGAFGKTVWRNCVIIGKDREVRKTSPETIRKIHRDSQMTKMIDVASVCNVDNSPYSLQQNEIVPILKGMKINLDEIKQKLGRPSVLKS